ncbi:MAG TPA: NUDIX hydrolase [Rhizomicrobium sp.]|jgi:8-oxo-dGTP pyrophosphatase MutT (NUDIX family)|nr:NUDIX hydrolase [Rhizomicrobium sp.]
MRTSVATPHAAAKKTSTGTQYAALPYRLTPEGVEILLITSRRTRRWIVPKGWPIEGLTPPASAAREALEEAGISGEMQKASLGFFHYFKTLRNNITVPCKVEVFALKVTRQRKTWAEKEAREQRWFGVAEAARLVGEPQLRRLILKFGAQFPAPPLGQH